MPDVIAVVVSFYGGPNGITHAGPVGLALLVPGADGIDIVTTAPIDSVVGDYITRSGDEIDALTPARLPTDGFCCASGTRAQQFQWTDGGFVETAGCVRDGRSSAIGCT